jgi:hypothetical protein
VTQPTPGFLERSQLPRRILGAMLSVLVPGAGHVVLGYSKLGWVIAAVSLALGAVVVASAIHVATTVFLIGGAMYILGTVASVVTVFALPPGPAVRQGLRALWPVLVLALGFRGAAYVVRTYELQAEVITDNALAPEVVEGDVLLIHPGSFDAKPGDVIRYDGASEAERHVARVLGSPDPSHLALKAADGSTHTVAASTISGRGLFVMATTGKVKDGRGRIWKPLTPR